MEIEKSFLPKISLLKLDNCQIDSMTSEIWLNVTSTQALAHCPVCHQINNRVHSKYERIVKDIPWGKYEVKWQLEVRKFFCSNPKCQRKIFTERLPDIVTSWGRKTCRLVQRQVLIGLALGGIAGSRLAKALGYTTSRQTLLREIAKLPLKTDVNPIVIGIDDWAYRKGRNYGSIVVDLETHQPITLLSNRESETVTEWLEEYPDVEIVSRDRSKAYEKGARNGAPQAIQVADRFHLIQNLGETLEKVFMNHTKDLQAVEESLNCSLVCEDESVAQRISPPISPAEALAKAEQRRQRRLEIYNKIIELRNLGMSGKAIAAQLGISKTTVFRYLATSGFPERKGRSDKGRSLIDEYKDYFLKRWNEGCYEAKQLFFELQELGYQGSYATVARYAQRLRKAQGIKPRQTSFVSKPRIVLDDLKLPLTIRRATSLILRREENRDSTDEYIIEQLQNQNPILSLAIELSQTFIKLIRERTPEEFDEWLAQVQLSEITPLVNFAQGLIYDYDAVKSGMTLSWNNGPVEGQINRLKMLKRQMYGRASLELLTRRFLWAI